MSTIACDANNFMHVIIVWTNIHTELGSLFSKSN